MKKIVFQLKNLICAYNINAKMTIELRNYLTKNFLVRRYNGIIFDCKVYRDSQIKAEFNRNNVYAQNSKAFKFSTASDYKYMLSHINKTEEEAIEENNKVVIVNYPEGLFVHKIIETKKIFHQYITEIESNFANVKDRKFVYNFYITPSFLFANESLVRMELVKFYLQDFPDEKLKKNFNDYYSMVNYNVLKLKKNFPKFPQLPQKIEHDFHKVKQDPYLPYLLYTNNFIRNEETLINFHKSLLEYKNLITNDKEIEKAYQGGRRRFRILSKKHSKVNDVLNRYLDIEIYLTKDFNSFKIHIQDYINFLEQFYI